MVRLHKSALIVFPLYSSTLLGPSASPPAVKASDRVPLPGTPVGATVQSNRIPLKRGSTPISAENGAKRFVGSPLQRRITASVKTPGRQTTPTRTAVSEEKRIPLVTIGKLIDALVKRIVE